MKYDIKMTSITLIMIKNKFERVRIVEIGLKSESRVAEPLELAESFEPSKPRDVSCYGCAMWHNETLSHVQVLLGRGAGHAWVGRGHR